MIRAVLQRLGQVSQSGPDRDITTLVRREFGLRARARNRGAYDEACTHSSMLDGDKTGLKSNERLEFLGDVVLDMTMAHYLYRNFPEAQEGELTKRKSRIVNRKNLNLLGKKMGLHHLIKAKMRREDIHDTMVGNALEALIGIPLFHHQTWPPRARRRRRSCPRSSWKLRRPRRRPRRLLQRDMTPSTGRASC